MKKIVYAALILVGLCACGNDDIAYYPIGKKHLGETYTSYTINNISQTDSVELVVLNFYPWAYDTESSYVKVQYGQNAMWYTVNAQQHEGEYIPRANDGMSVRMLMRAGSGAYLENGEVYYRAEVTVRDFSIEEVAEE